MNSHLIRSLSLDYELYKHPKAQVVTFNLPNQVKIRGLLLLKDEKPRPLVIIRTGIFSTLQTIAPEKFLIEQIFEEGTFHVLVLSSLSGIDFSKDNSHYIFGGFEEAIQQILIGKQLRDPQFRFSNLITGLRLAGFSMGGQGAYISTVLNEKDPQDQSQSLFQKTLLLCPLVQFNETLEYHHKHFINRILINLWGGIRLQPLRKRSDNKTEALTSFSIQTFLNSLRKNYTEPLVGWNALKDLGLENNLLHKLERDSFSGRGKAASNKSNTEKDFFALSNDNQFWLNAEISTPILIVATKEDLLVPRELNLDKVSNPKVKKIILPMGTHCTLPSAYKWKALSNTFNQFLK